LVVGNRVSSLTAIDRPLYEFGEFDPDQFSRSGLRLAYR
jgi:hypothetical protein